MIGLVGLPRFLFTARADTILLREGGQLNGQPIAPGRPLIVVQPGKDISGTIEISAHNSHSVGPIVPVGATVTWGNRASQAWEVRRHVSPGSTNISVAVRKTAPSEPGVYYLVIANAGECNYLQVMSGTNWALPNSPIIAAWWNQPRSGTTGTTWDGTGPPISSDKRVTRERSHSSDGSDVPERSVKRRTGRPG
jgi:hypothetical protein